MRGVLPDIPLIGVLELLHFSRKTGVLNVEAELPYTLAFMGGEIVEGGILDWLGLDAVYCSPLVPGAGRFVFQSRDVTGLPLSGFNMLSADWARFSDEWERLCAVIASPSRVLEGSVPYFEEGRSVRSVARASNLPLFQVAETAAEGVRAGKLRLVERFAWFGLRLRRPNPRTELERLLDGERSFGDLIAAGVGVPELRAYLLSELRAGLRFPGSGWVLRDLVWEEKYLDGTGR